MPRLAGKVALITGAAGGQGTLEAELFVRAEIAIGEGYIAAFASLRNRVREEYSERKN